MGEFPPPPSRAVSRLNGLKMPSPLFPTLPLNEQVAEIIRYAADHCLSADAKEFRNFDAHYGNKRGFSCTAISFATTEYDGPYPTQPRQTIFGFLQYLGCNTGGTGEFGEFYSLGGLTPESQAARFFWLDFAAHVAENDPELYFASQA